jgi:hypothetical protein
MVLATDWQDQLAGGVELIVSGDDTPPRPGLKSGIEPARAWRTLPVYRNAA